MKTSSLFYFVFGSFWLISGNLTSLNAQSILDGYIREGLASNLQLQQERLNYEKSAEALNIARALFMPSVAINASYSIADGGRKIQFPIGDLLNPAYAALNQLTDSNQFPQLANQSIQFLPNNFHDTKVRVVQPIFNPDIYFNYKAQKELISVQQAQKNSYENELKYSITAAYYQYLQSVEALKVLNTTRDFLKELLKINQKLVANQRATKDVVLTAEYELTKVEQQLADAVKNNEVASAYFNFLLNKDLGAAIERDTSLLASTIQTYQLDELKNTALAQRQEIKQVESGLLASEHLVGLNKATSLLPKVNVVGDAGYQGFGYHFNSSQQYWFVQFSLGWDLFKGGEKRARTQQSRLDYQVTENKMEQLKKQIELQVIQSHYERESAQQAYVTSQSGVRSAEKSFQIVRSKYNEGTAILLEYLDAQNRWTTSRLTESLRLFDLLRAESNLKKTIASL